MGALIAENIGLQAFYGVLAVIVVGILIAGLIALIKRN